MDEGEKLKLVRLFYAALMVDSASNYERQGMAEEVAARKAAEQLAAAPGQMAQLGIDSPRAMFEVLAGVFGCADWKLREEGGELVAETATCLACAIAKRRGSGRPCSLYCINPFRAYAAALAPKMSLEVRETLWEGGRCLFRVGPA
jgi:hypothetical protein